MPVEQYRAPFLATDKTKWSVLVTLYSQKEDNEASSHASELNLPRSTNLSIVGFKNGRFLSTAWRGRLDRMGLGTGVWGRRLRLGLGRPAKGWDWLGLRTPLLS